MLEARRHYFLVEKHFGLKRDWYRIHDTEPSHGAIRLKQNEADTWNKSGWGIFHTVNSFSGPRRKENLLQIQSWAIDIDKGSKEKQIERIKNAPVAPSLVVETKNGHHVYWHSKDATLETYEAIVCDRLIPYFNADEKAKDVARVLRVPGYYHQKNPKNPFLVELKYWSDSFYDPYDMIFAFRLPPEKEKESLQKQEIRNALRSEGETLWERVYNLDCEQGLQSLSGTHYVNGETYTFRKVSSGNLNIYVNGKSTSSFIDTNKRIGSLSNGGPTIFNWLKWYGRTNQEVNDIMKDVFSELYGTRA